MSDRHTALASAYSTFAADTSEENALGVIRVINESFPFGELTEADHTVASDIIHNKFVIEPSDPVQTARYSNAVVRATTLRHLIAQDASFPLFLHPEFLAAMKPMYRFLGPL